MTRPMTTLIVWRHPKPIAVAGRCIGHTDVAVDRRRAKRLAHRIRQRARRDGLARVVFTSPLRRGAEVGRWLARWGWQHRTDARLAEMDFGTWDGARWDDIGAAAVEAWCQDFAAHRVGGGESVARLLQRCEAFAAEHADVAAVCVVGHAGWISAAQWLVKAGAALPAATDWPPAVGYAEAVTLTIQTHA